MKKLLLILTAILSSGLFMPVTFIGGGILGSSRIVAEALCALGRDCKETYTDANIYGAARFWVAVYRPSDGHVDQVPLLRWTDEKLKDPAASLLLPAKNITTDRATQNGKIPCNRLGNFQHAIQPNHFNKWLP
jgi:hypothetical protein